jgi:hypothetical protein
MQRPTVARASRYGERERERERERELTSSSIQIQIHQWVARGKKKQLTNGVAIQSSVMWGED